MSEIGGVDVVLIDNATGEPPRLVGAGDSLVTLSEPKRQRDGTYRQLVEVRRRQPIEEAEVAVYDAIETLRGRVEVAGLGSGPGVKGTPRLRGQRLRSAAKLVSNAVNDLARAIEGGRG